RIALLEPDGEVNTVIGSTSKGNQDGRFSEAKFNYPGGVSFMPATNTLYIADTYNHRICAADLETQKVSTLLGGKQPVSKTDKGKTITGIGLPVDVLAGNKSLYFVSAWDMGVYAWDLVAEKLTQLAVLQPQMPDSLQPVAPINMAIYTDSSMAVACSNGQWFEVFINGGIQELKFNDREGNAVYPSSISRSGSTLYAADTHRHGIWEVKEGVCTEFSGFGGEGFASGKLKKCLYNRPFDLSVAKEKLWVSDGYNHQLRWMKLGKKKMNTYLLRDYEVLTRLGDAPNTGQRVTLEPVSAGPGINRITIRYNHPGYLVVQSGKNEAHTDGSEGVKITGFRPAEGILELEVDADKLPGQFQLEFYLTLSPETAPSQLYLKTIFLTLPIASGGEKTGHSLKFEPAIGWN
ncbi:MAG: hypothetical protein JNM00_15770, partial [Flavobacteriales bacterium]|nr:hypothetical protein [Flavobacteriales bacterium]